MPQSHKACERELEGGIKSWRGKDLKKKRKKETDDVTASEGDRERCIEGVTLSSLGIKSQWTLPDLWHNKHIIFWAALLSSGCYTDTLWFLSLLTDTTVSYPVWSTFWFRDESHRGTLKCTAPTLCPVDPELIMTVGTAHPPNTTPPPAVATQGQQAWPWLGLNNWHAGGCERCWHLSWRFCSCLIYLLPGRVSKSNDA